MRLNSKKKNELCRKLITKNSTRQCYLYLRLLYEDGRITEIKSKKNTARIEKSKIKLEFWATHYFESSLLFNDFLNVI